MATQNGSSGNDTLHGTSGNDQTSGGAGNDTIYAGDGKDSVYGGDGYDRMYGGAGGDKIYGGDDTQKDDIYGGEGGDEIQTSNAHGNQVNGGAGDDKIYGGDGDDYVEGGTGKDKIETGGGNDRVYGQDGDDDIKAGEGDDSAYGGTGSDDIYGGEGHDLIQGQQGDDRLYGGEGNDTFQFSDDEGEDETDGGDGHDTLHFLGTENLELTFDGDGSGEYEQNNENTKGEFSNIEEIRSGAGDDRIDAAQDTKGVTLSSGAGNDTLIGGSGDDRLSGGDGTDLITTGAGQDTVALDRGGDHNVVTDFDLGDGDGNGFSNDQIDISELKNPDGTPVKGADVVVGDDGNGNALLTFPEGETLVLQGVSPAQMSSAGQRYKAGIPCFTTGTMILTPQGERPIEMLCAGDMVVTRDNGPQPIRWMGMRPVRYDELRAHPELAPIRIAAGAFGNERALVVSPQHGVLAQTMQRGGDQRLVRAVHLARLNGGKIRVMQGARSVTYVHLLFDAHQVVFSNGIASESFYPGPWGLKALAPDVQLELLHLWPALGTGHASGVYGQTVRQFSKFKDLPLKQRDMRLMCA